MAIIYIKPFEQSYISDQKPIFLRKYEIQIESIQLQKSVPLIKIEAISMNPYNNLPIQYKLINKNEKFFFIDSIQGLVYLSDNVNLENKIYEFTVFLKIIRHHFF